MIKAEKEILMNRYVTFSVHPPFDQLESFEDVDEEWKEVMIQEPPTMIGCLLKNGIIPVSKLGIVFLTNIKSIDNRSYVPIFFSEQS